MSSSAKRILKIGNSCGVTLNRKQLAAMGVNRGDLVEVSVCRNGQVVVKKQAEKEVLTNE